MTGKAPVVPGKYIFPFILVTTLFALWGFANDVTNPLVAVFKDVFVISNAQSTMVQLAFYGGYGTMALPAALFIRKYSYKSGILLGLLLYACGAMLSIPAASMANFNLFILGLYILTFGLAFLETTANPYILSMGPAETATRRLNLAQAFNPMGSLTGMFIAGSVILSTIYVEDFKADVSGFYAEKVPAKKSKDDLKILPFLKAKTRDRVNDPNVEAYVDQTIASAEKIHQTLESAKQNVKSLSAEKPIQVIEHAESILTKELKDLAPEELNMTKYALVDYKEGNISQFNNMTHTELQHHDLKIVSMPYMVIGFVVIGVFLLFLVTKLPDTSQQKNLEDLQFGKTVARLLQNPRYVGGVVAQTFYVGAQIMCWTFIIQYAENELGIDKATAQNHNIMAMIIFLSSRFVCTYFLKYISPGKLLAALAVAGFACVMGAIHLKGMPGLYSLVAVSACMSLMFPTIYGLALDGVGEDAKLGSAGLIFAIVGGALLPQLQGAIMDRDSFMGTTATRGSFYLPALCFIVIAIYGLFCFRRKVKPIVT